MAVQLLRRLLAKGYKQACNVHVARTGWEHSLHCTIAFPHTSLANERALASGSAVIQALSARL